MKRWIVMSLMVAMSVSLLGCSSKEKSGKEESVAMSQPIVERQGGIPGLSDDNRLPVVVDFFATWCGPCHQMKPVFEAAEKEYEGKVLFLTVDVDENPELAQQFNVSAIPTLVFANAKGEELNRHTGYMAAEELDEAIKALLGE